MSEIITPKQFTRRDLLRLASIGIVGAAVAPAKSASSGTRGLLAARGMAMAKRGGGHVYFGYVADGLEALYDGVQNTRSGYSSTASKWENLVSDNLDLDIKSSGLWGDKYLNCLGLSSAAGNYSNEIGMNEYHTKTIEVVIRPEYANALEVVAITNPDSSWQFGIVLVRGVCTQVSPSFSGYYGTDLLARNSVGSISCAYDVTNDGLYVDVTPYVNGTASQKLSYRDGWSTYWVKSGMCVGGRHDNYYAYTGRIYCIRIYDRKLSDSEIAANYAVDKARFNLT